MNTYVYYLTESPETVGIRLSEGYYHDLPSAMRDAKEHGLTVVEIKYRYEGELVVRDWSTKSPEG